jgi:hypothetical protein
LYIIKDMVGFPTPKAVFDNAPLIVAGLAGLYLVVQANSILNTKQAMKALRRLPFPVAPIPPWQGSGYGFYFDTPDSELLRQVDWGGNNY